MNSRVLEFLTCSMCELNFMGSVKNIKQDGEVGRKIII